MKAERKYNTKQCLLGAKLFLSGLLLGTMTACGGGADSEAADASVVIPPVAKIDPGTWVVMGSSTAAGAGAPTGKGWVASLAQSYAGQGVQVANIAKGGTVTYEGLSTATASVAGRPAANPAINIDQALSRKPVLLIVSYPANDTAHGYSADETVRNLLAIRSQALAAGVPVVMTSSLPRNLTATQLSRLRAIDERLAANVGPCLVDIRQPLAAADGRLAAAYDSGDGVHPNESGHLIIANQVKQLIDSKKCVSTSAI